MTIEWIEANGAWRSESLLDPIFLTLDEVLALQEHQIQRYGGRRGLRQTEVLYWALRAVSATLV